MSRWEDTPFESIEQAREWAEANHLRPTALVEDVEHGLRTFRIPSTDVVVAQQIQGGTVRQRVIKPPAYDPTKRKLAGPWNKNKTFRSLEDVERRYQGHQFEVERAEVVYVRFKKDVYEYKLVNGRILSRVLTTPK